jgi:hypothetical protein
VKYYYFFHHALEAGNGYLGRYAFDAHGWVVAPDGTSSLRSIQIPVDGHGPNQPGSNIDPCPFARALPLAHTFCLLDDHNNRACVDGTGQTLAEVVSAGDTVFYGSIRIREKNPARTRFYVDTVLVVADVRTLPTQGGRFDMGPAFAEAVLGPQWPGTPQEKWTELQTMDLWQFNLIDASPGRNHESTRIQDHRILVGAVAEPRDASEHLRLRCTSYVPLVDLVPDQPCSHQPLPPAVVRHLCPELWQELRQWVADNPRLEGSLKPPTRMPDDLGHALYDCVRTLSGRGSDLCGYVALPPLRWLCPNARSSNAHTGAGNC